MTLIDKVKISPSYRSDYAMIELYITFTAFERGKGILKFNNSLLYDCVYVDRIKDTIRNDKQKYAVLTYNPCDVHNIPMEDLFCL